MSGIEIITLVLILLTILNIITFGYMFNSISKRLSKAESGNQIVDSDIKQIYSKLGHVDGIIEVYFKNKYKYNSTTE